MDHAEDRKIAVDSKIGPRVTRNLFCCQNDTMSMLAIQRLWSPLCHGCEIKDLRTNPVLQNNVQPFFGRCCYKALPVHPFQQVAQQNWNIYVWFTKCWTGPQALFLHNFKLEPFFFSSLASRTFSRISPPTCPVQTVRTSTTFCWSNSWHHTTSSLASTSQTLSRCHLLQTPSWPPPWPGLSSRPPGPSSDNLEPDTRGTTE